MSHQNLSPARLEAFSDGVIAVIITVMVLELKVPQHDGMAGVLAVLPAIFLYLLSFIQVGIYWVNHHYLLDDVERVGHAALWANLIFLFFLSLFPFATSWIGEKGVSSFSTALYAGVSFLPGASYSVLSTLVRPHRTTPPPASWGKQATSVALYLGAVPVAFYRPAVSVAMIVAVAVLWVLPPRVSSSERVSEHPQRERG